MIEDLVTGRPFWVCVSVVLFVVLVLYADVWSVARRIARRLKRVYSDRAG